MKQKIKVRNKYFRRYLGVIFASLFFILGPFSGTALADAGFTVTESSGSTAVSESGSTDTFTVVLDEQPSSDVVFSVSTGDSGEATVSPTTLTFTSGNWNSAQTVTVTGVNDDLIDGSQTTTITLSVVDAISDDDFDSLADKTVSVSTTDNDTASFTVAQSSGSTAVSESGSTDTFTVVLGAQPASNVVISVTSGDTGEATVSPATLTFTSGNWNSAQTVTVTGINDDLVDGTQTSTTTMSVVDASSDNNFDSLADQTVSVTTADTDVAGFTKIESGGSTTVAESGTTDTFTVVLDAQPASDVVISVTSGDTGEATVSPATLTFTSGNWNSAQTVTVTGVNDSLIDGSQNTTITMGIVDGSSDNSFDSLADQTVTVSTADNDTASFTVAQSGGSTSVAESGTTDTFTVVLDAQPASNVVISVTSNDTTEATVSPATLTFTSGNWNSAQTVTVTGADDNAVDGPQGTSTILSVVDASSDNNFDSLADQTVSVTTTDNDTASFTVTQSGGSTSVAESGTTDTFTVVLGAQPTSDVVISVTSGDTGEATVSPATLTFTSGNWNSAQTVTVTGVNDSLIDGSQNTTITMSVVDSISNDSFDSLADQTVTAATTDNDTAGFTVTQSSGSTSVAESGTTDTFTVVLNAQPNSDVVISVSSGDTGEATVSPATLTFTSGNWNSAQTVTVAGVNDSLVDGTQTSTLTLSVVDGSSDNNFDPVADQTVSAATTDNDTAGFTVVQSGGSTSVAETGSTDTFTVVLDAQPTSDVVISVTSGDTGEATVSTGTLTFTSGNWNSAQTVTVTGVDDSLVDGSQTTVATISVVDASSDDDFDGIANQTVSITTTNDDTAGFTVAISGGSTSVAESGSTDTFTVVLNAQPASNVVISVTSGDTGEATVSPGTLTFTSGNWNSAQTVTVTGVDDSLVDGSQTTAATISVVDASSDDNFDGVANQTTNIETTDNDSVGFTLVESSGSTTVNESGTTDTFTVVLNAQPLFQRCILNLLQEIPAKQPLPVHSHSLQQTGTPHKP
ncbi:MAG: beta strand repeat-containing protein [Acidimicrobiales bacterium]